MGLKVKPLEIGTSGIIPCGHIENDPDVRLVQWYKSRNIDAFENGDPSLASRTEKESISQPNYRIDNTTFSLAIGNVSLENQGLYKCYVVHGDLLNRSNYYTRTVTYGEFHHFVKGQVSLCERSPCLSESRKFGDTGFWTLKQHRRLIKNGMNVWKSRSLKINIYILNLNRLIRHSTEMHAYIWTKSYYVLIALGLFRKSMPVSLVFVTFNWR